MDGIDEVKNEKNSGQTRCWWSCPLWAGFGRFPYSLLYCVVWHWSQPSVAECTAFFGLKHQWIRCPIHLLQHANISGGRVLCCLLPGLHRPLSQRTCGSFTVPSKISKQTCKVALVFIFVVFKNLPFLCWVQICPELQSFWKCVSLVQKNICSENRSTILCFKNSVSVHCLLLIEEKLECHWLPSMALYWVGKSATLQRFHKQDVFYGLPSGPQTWNLWNTKWKWAWSLKMDAAAGQERVWIVCGLRSSTHRNWGSVVPLLLQFCCWLFANCNERVV